MGKLAFVDIETTGMSTYADRIIEVGILVWENNKVIKKYSQLIDPEVPVNPYITGITGIKSDDLTGSPTFHQVASEIFDILNDCTFVAHNVRFDYGFMKAEFERAGYNFKMPHFCTVRLSRALYPEHPRHGLDSIIKNHNIKCKNRHRAFDDAEVICKFYKQELKRLGQEELDRVISQTGKRISWPLHIPKEDIERLPHAPGVYIFYGENDSVLYVGKSIDIKSRVLSHFSDDVRSSKEMKLAQQVRKIITHQTAGELGALVKESQMVKDLMPLYNRRLRKSKQLILLKSYLGDDGYMRMKVTTASEEEITPEDLNSIYGVFRSKNQATNTLIELADEHKLCRKLLGLEKTQKRCFGYQLKKCDGACVGESPAALFNARCEVAFSGLRLKKWPFGQPIKIKEKNEGRAEEYLVDNWCLFKSDDDGEVVMPEFKFDLDIYKILKSYLNSPKHQSHILPVNQGTIA